MDLSDSILERYKNRDSAPRHSKAASVNEIVKLLGENKTYNYAYWLKKVGNASYSDVLAIVKDASNLDTKYSKGGFVTNALKKYVIPTSNTTRPRTNGRGTQRTQGKQQVHNQDIRKVDDSKERLES